MNFDKNLSLLHSDLIYMYLQSDIICLAIMEHIYEKDSICKTNLAFKFKSKESPLVVVSIIFVL